MATQIVPHQPTALAVTGAEQFQLKQRQARMFAMSPLVPEHLRKGSPDQAMANCYIALALAEAMGEMPLIVMQNIHIISGKAGFASKYMIARANASGKFLDDIDWEISNPGGNNLTAVCFATLAKTGKRVQMKADMAMAKAEGWTNNKKYSTMPEVMLRYRSASFLVNMYAPEVMLGYKTIEEVEDIGVSAMADTPIVTAAMIEAQANDEVVDAEVSNLPTDTEIAASQEGPADEDRGEAHTDTDAEADILFHLARKETVIDVNSLIESRIGELDEEAADRVRSAAMARIAELKGGR